MSLPFYPQPKPNSKLADRVAEKKAAAELERIFRLAVLARDKMTCQACQRKVIRTIELVPNRAEVHHVRGRRVRPEDRYVVAKSVTLCAACHRDPVVIQRFRK